MAAQHEVFRDTGWLETHGNMVPDKDKAEEYFTGTPWYEKTCLNEQWKAQRIPPKNIEDVRRRCSGTAYRLVHENCQAPLLYVLRKEHLEPGQKPSTLASYYILDGTIYQAPTVEQVITSRLAKCVHHVQAAMSLLQERAVCEAKHSFASLWDFESGAMETGQNRQQLLRRGGPAARCTTLVAGASFDGSHTRHRLNSSRADRTGRDVHQILHELQAQFPLPSPDIKVQSAVTTGAPSAETTPAEQPRPQKRKRHSGEHEAAA